MSAGWRRRLLVAAGLAAAVYAMAAVDVTLRARSACLEGDKWMEWSRHPELKKAHFDAELAARETALRAERAAGKIDDAVLERKLALAKFERDQALEESALKYAFTWYQSAAELFTPPESRWSKRGRERMLEARELWKKELDAKKIAYQDYMLE